MTGSDSARFAELYEGHHRHVYAYCRRRIDNSRVDDVVADVYLTVWRRIADAPAGDEIRPWLYRIAYLVMSNHWRGLARKRKLKRKLESLGITPGISIPYQIVVRDQVRRALDVLKELSPADQEILRLAVWEQLSSDEIATVLAIEPNAARQRLYRAKRRLAAAYQREHGHDVNSTTTAQGGEQ